MPGTVNRPDTFFACSGFIIPVSLERVGDLRAFWASRAMRLYPLYWLSLALAAVLAASGRYAYLGPQGPTPATTWLASATVMQMFVGQPNVLIIYWTLAWEMLFYIFSLVVCWGSKGVRIPGVLLRLGIISYSIYLLQAVVLAVLPLSAGIPVGVTVTTRFAATLGLSALTYRWIEKPALDLGRWARRWRQAPSLPTAAQAAARTG